MIYKLVSSKVCIAKVIDKFNIDYSGFIPRVPDYIYSALRELKVIPASTTLTETSTVETYKCELPSALETLLAITYNGYRLPRIDTINEREADNMVLLWHPTYKYELDNNNNAIFSFEDGEVDIIYKKLPIEYDTVTRLWFPSIPDNEELYTGLCWYILMRVLQRGHNVPGYSLRDPNEETNPAKMWKNYKTIIRNELHSLDGDGRKELSDMVNNFIIDYYSYYNTEINPTRLAV